MIIFILTIEYVLLIDIPFYGDSITKSIRANWILSHNFSTLIVPTEINSGHPPLWITLMAFFWKIFGKAIWSARLLMLLVNIGVFFELYKFVKRSFGKSIPIILCVIIFLEPTLLAQSTFLNNDMLLLYFTLLALNSLFSNSHLIYIVAITGLLLTNLRGIYVSVALLIIHYYLIRKHLIPKNRKMYWAYFFGIVSFAIFLIIQYYQLGWALVTQQKNFAEHRKVTSSSLIFKNVLVFGKNMLEFGRFIIWIPILVAFKFLKSGKLVLNDKMRSVIITLNVFIIVLFLGTVPFSNPFSPRYFMIIYLLATILSLQILFSAKIKSLYKKTLAVLITIAFITGNLWVYPSKIAQPWDCTLLYLVYFKQENKMMDYILAENFPIADIGTNMYLTNPDSAPDVNNTEVLYFSQRKLLNNKYVIFTNVENRTTDEQIELLETKWIHIKTFSKLGVFISLYKNPK